MRFHCTNGSGVTAQLRTLEGALIAKKCDFLAAVLHFHSCFFTYCINQEWANLFDAGVICRKPKTPASRKTGFSCLHKHGKECKFYMK